MEANSVIKLSNYGSDGLPRMAENLSYPSTILNNAGYVAVTGINPLGSLTEVLSLTGKFSINYLALNNLTAETGTIKLTIDDEVIWNSTYTFQTQVFLIGAAESSAGMPTNYQCDRMMVLEVQTLTDTSIDLFYNVVPIK